MNKRSSKLNVIDLFSGCGGLSYGFVMAGYNVPLGIDVNKAALQTFKYNHTHSETLAADISMIRNKDIENVIGKKKINIIVGGPPCQGFSLSGPRQFDDSRNKLFLSFLRLTKEIRPKVFLIENVPGMVGLYGGQIRDEIIKRFAALGYNVNYQIMMVADYGVPQIRRRVIFVGIHNSEKAFKFPPVTLKEKEYITCEEAISDLPPLDEDLGTDPSPYNENIKLTSYQKKMQRGISHLHNHIGTDHSEKTKHIISLVPEGGNYKDLPDKYKSSRNFHVAWTRFHGNRPAPTIDTGHRHHFHYKYNRVPSVRESARLQSFPDKFIFFGNKSEQYAQVGNAVPPLLAKALAKQVKRYL